MRSGLTRPRHGHGCWLRQRDDGYKIVVMTKRPVDQPRRKRRARAPATGRPVAAAVFKAKCLELMDRVRETGEEYVVTKHGEPVAKLVPYTGHARRSLFGSMKGTVLAFERPFDPIDGEWDVNRD
jgi:prevent-host-death family protein